MNKKYVAFLFLAAIISGIVMFVAKPEREEVHYHAGFRIYKNNEPLDFSSFEYMHVKPCSGDDHEDVDEETIHLHDSIGDVVHIHAEGATWGKVFERLNLKENSVIAYNKGEKIENPMDQPVLEYQSMLFLIGENNKINISDQSYYVTQEEIEKVEALTESCGS